MRNHELKFGTEQDLNIQVDITDSRNLHCFRIQLGDATILLHARSLADLIHKSQIALLDWNARALSFILAEKGKQ